MVVPRISRWRDNGTAAHPTTTSLSSIPNRYTAYVDPTDSKFVKDTDLELDDVAKSTAPKQAAHLAPPQRPSLRCTSHYLLFPLRTLT